MSPTSKPSIRAAGPNRFPPLLPKLVAVGTVLLVLAVAFAAARSYRDLAASRDRVSTLDREIGSANERITELEGQIELLQDDPVTLERLARGELGMARPDEVVVVLPEDNR